MDNTDTFVGLLNSQIKLLQKIKKGEITSRHFECLNKLSKKQLDEIYDPNANETNFQMTNIFL